MWLSWLNIPSKQPAQTAGAAPAAFPTLIAAFAGAEGRTRHALQLGGGGGVIPTTGIPCGYVCRGRSELLVSQLCPGITRRLHTELGRSWAAAPQPLCRRAEGVPGSPGKGR